MPESVLTAWQRRLLRVVVALGLVLVANATFLLLFRATQLTDRWRLPHDTLPAFYQVMVLAHTWVGIVVAPLAIAFAIWHLRRAWVRRHPSAVSTGIGLLSLMLVLTTTGFFILTEANSREHRPFYWTHVALGIGLPLVYAWHRLVSAVRPSGRRIRLAVGGAGSVAVALLAVHLVTLPGKNRRAVADDVVTRMTTVVADARLTSAGSDPFMPFTPFADVPGDSRFFPSAATTATGGWMPSRIVTRNELPAPEALAAEVKAYGFVKDHLIGAETCQRCHASIVAQWSVSAHRFSSMNNPFYRKPFLDMRARPDIGKVPSQWCSGCHEPALMQAGQVVTDFDPDSANAQAGLTCLACHAIDAIHNRTGNGAYNIPDHLDSPYLFDTSRHGLGREVGDMIIKAKPTVHKAQMLKPFHREAEFCSPCHKVSLDTPVNKYRWLRGQNEYDAWHDSGVARNAARTFYLPPAKRVCQDCHMPLEPATLGDVSAKKGMVRSHRFLAVNTALPTLRGDTDTVHRIEQFLQAEKLRVDLFALRRLNADGSERSVVTALDLTRPSLVAGERVELQVVVRNLGVGHGFPGGTNDSNEGWLELIVKQPGRDAELHSGALDEARHLDAEAHRYTLVMAAHDGTEADKRNPHDFHVPVYVKTIGPGTADVARYQFTVPEVAAGSQLEIAANLKWRKFKQQYVEYVFAGKTAPVLPVTTIASATLTLPVVAAGTQPMDHATPETADPAQWARFNDLGIGLLLAGDSVGAVRAFEAVKRLFPARVDGSRNLARVHVQDGNLAAAYDELRHCEEIAPGDAQTAWVWGTVLQEDGRYSEAADAYRRTLETFPQDRDTWRRLGRTLYLDGRFEDSLAAWGSALAIDPEDAMAHYHRMLCYRALGKSEAASEAERAYRKYQVDESAQAITQAFRLRDPNAQRESQVLHAHELTWRPASAAPEARAAGGT